MPYGNRDSVNIVLPKDEIKRLEEAKKTYRKEVQGFTDELVKLKYGIKVSKKTLKDLNASIELAKKESAESADLQATKLRELNDSIEKKTEAIEKKEKAREIKQAKLNDLSSETSQRIDVALEQESSAKEALSALKKERTAYNKECKKGKAELLVLSKGIEESVVLNDEKLASIKQQLSLLEISTTAIDKKQMEISESSVILKGREEKLIKGETKLLKDRQSLTNEAQEKQAKLDKDVGDFESIKEASKEKDSYLLIKEKALDNKEHDLNKKQRDIEKLIKQAGK